MSTSIHECLKLCTATAELYSNSRKQSTTADSARLRFF